MHVIPLGARILVRPDFPAPESDLIVAPDTAAKPPEMSGTVIALGAGPQRDAKLKREVLLAVRDIVEEVADIFPNKGGAAFDTLRDELGRFGAIRPTEYEVQVGDRVLFPWNCGTKFTLEGEDYLVLTEDDPIVVLVEEEETAA